MIKKHMRSFLKMGDAIDTAKVQENFRPQ
jgi:hypothetical protein